ncbi:MAG: hypothetical protein OXG15_07275 [Gammaproteobacteria bacterium]|nr:hypothetical protein [Gammaproteobacteria bacterium]
MDKVKQQVINADICDTLAVISRAVNVDSATMPTDRNHKGTFALLKVLSDKIEDYFNLHGVEAMAEVLKECDARRGWILQYPATNKTLTTRIGNYLLEITKPKGKSYKAWITRYW